MPRAPNSNTGHGFVALMNGMSNSAHSCIIHATHTRSIHRR